MDYFDQLVLTALKDGKPKSFIEIQSQVGFSHNPLQQHLMQLLEKGLVLKEKDPARGFGRPRYVYHIASKTTKQVAVALDKSDVELVTLPFSRLNHVRLVRLKSAPKQEK